MNIKDYDLRKVAVYVLAGLLNSQKNIDYYLDKSYEKGERVEKFVLDKIFPRLDYLERRLILHKYGKEREPDNLFVADILSLKEDDVKKIEQAAIKKLADIKDDLEILINNKH